MAVVISDSKEHGASKVQGLGLGFVPQISLSIFLWVLWILNRSITPRAYTKQFGYNLIDAASRHRPCPTIRQKVPIDPKATDVQLFSQLDLGDVWEDADLVSVYKYLRQGVTVPDTWQLPLAKLDNELSLRGLL